MTISCTMSKDSLESSGSSLSESFSDAKQHFGSIDLVNIFVKKVQHFNTSTLGRFLMEEIKRLGGQ
jgi:hypothetical protein